MTRAENEAKLAELKSKAEELVKEYNEAIQTGKFEDASKTDEVLTQTINEYTATVRDMCFEDCKNTPDPLRTAVRTIRRGFPVSYSASISPTLLCIICATSSALFSPAK